jgi:hypothetical protein
VTEQRGDQDREPADTPDRQWMTRGVGGIGTASFLADVGHEVPTALMASLVTGTLGARADRGPLRRTGRRRPVRRRRLADDVERRPVGARANVSSPRTGERAQLVWASRRQDCAETSVTERALCGRRVHCAPLRYGRTVRCDDVDMNTGRIAVIASCLLMAAMGVWFAVARWDNANKVATMASALGAVAAVGVAVWAALRTPPSRTSLTVSDTGRATADSGGKAITGFSGKANRIDGQVRVERTGDAKASGGGDAITGTQLD